MRALRMVVSFAPGGSTDALARIVAQGMAEGLGQPVTVENRPGANPHMYAKVSYDPVRDFAPISYLANVPSLLRAGEVGEGADRAEQVGAGKLNYASAGYGSHQHLVGELFRLSTGADVTHVPFNGGNPAMLAVLGGQVQSGITALPTSLANLAAGKLRALAVTSDARSSALPDVPTFAEAGFPGLDSDRLIGLLAPAGTPRPVVSRLHAEAVKVMQVPEARKKLADLGFVVVGGIRGFMKVLSSIGMKAALERRIDAGMIEELAAQRKTGAPRPLARWYMAVGVRSGASKPDLGSTEAFKRALLEAKSIAYSKEGWSGRHAAKVVRELGLAEALAERTVLETRPGGAAVNLAEGKAELALTIAAEIVPVPGAELAGAFPGEVGLWVGFAVRRLGKPAIAAINGHAVGSGLGIAAGCDVRICAKGAKLGWVFTRRGIVPDDASLYLMPQLVGYARAFEWGITGRTLAPEEAERIGFLNAVVEPAEVMPRARALAKEIVDNVPPLTAQAFKLAIAESMERNLEASVAFAERAQRIVRASADHTEALRAYAEKRPPRWKDE
ncbi:MAG: tripartite tricarboxylate transporter substrate-binding protein [Betaproteobacteria bacterium]